MKKLLLLSLGLFLVSYTANAQLFSESFEGLAAGALVAQGSWIENTKYPTGEPIKVIASGLNGNRSANINPGGEAGDGPMIPFGSSDLELATTGTGTIYVSFLVKFNALPTTGNSYFFYLADVEAGSSDGRGRIYVKAEEDGTKFAFGALASSNDQNDLNYTPYNYEVGKTYLVVERYEKFTGDGGTSKIGTDNVSLWIFDANVTGGEPSATIISEKEAAGTAAVSKKAISGVGFRTMQTSFDIVVDDIKAATDWASVIGTNVPLPVKLTSFTAAVQNNAVKLNWATASEENNDRFEVLRSEDGKTFNTLTSVSGNGTTQSINNYSYTDANPLSGTNYYQLRQVDFDGKSELSKIVVVKTDLEQTDLKVHASSADAYVKVSVYALTNGAADVVVSDVSGVQLVKQRVQLSKGYNVLQVPAQTKPGVYVLTLKVGAEIKRVKFISQ